MSLQSPTLLKPAERWRLLLLTLGIAFLFTTGFLPTAQSFFFLVWNQFGGSPESPYAIHFEMLAFPLLAALFYFSLPLDQEPIAHQSRMILLSAPVAIAIAFASGWIRQSPSVFQTGLNADFFWYALWVPLGEEWIFRGWLYNVIERRYPGKLLTLTNPFPASVWATSLAFSLWHLQNLAALPVAVVALQIVYTFFAGLWLGYARWKTGRLSLCVGLHAALNISSLLV
ncbi:MAG: CPBP family intramembrane glutamic endopeptidase [Bdellovibrionota bacterium]